MQGIKLDCGHRVQIDVELRQQYPDDQHYILCPSCRNDPLVPLGWQAVVGMCPVSSELPQVMPRHILRLQPSVAPARKRPFPYKGRGIRGH